MKTMTMTLSPTNDDENEVLFSHSDSVWLYRRDYASGWQVNLSEYADHYDARERHKELNDAVRACYLSWDGSGTIDGSYTLREAVKLAKDLIDAIGH